MYDGVGLAWNRMGVPEGMSTSGQRPEGGVAEDPIPTSVRPARSVLSPEELAARYEAILASTWNGAKAIGIDATHGTLEVGKVANLVVLARNPAEDIRNLESVVLTMRDGILYPRADY